ncbi:MAG TPA: hypothetical protein VMX13_18150 [Sedimentisphaerales bacterium]|nr:hypothetical protein [Sedimentisphaerales bacterium]
MSSDGHTDMGGTGGEFATTQWTAIGQIRSAEARKEALIDDLLRKYWKPVYCCLRHKGYDNEQAKDLTQGFFHEVVLGRELIQQADRARGRFRTFLLFALERYLKSAHRKKTAKKRLPQHNRIRLEQTDPADLPQPVDGLSAGECFNYTWVSALLDKMLAEVEQQCRQHKLDLHWNLFCDRVVQPIMEASEPPSMAELCQKYGIDGTAAASNMLVAVKRRFQTALRQHLRESVSSDEAVNEELRELMQFFAKNSAR